VRTFVQKPKSSPESSSKMSTLSGRRLSGQHYQALHLTQDQAVQRLSEADMAIETGCAHDFSRIPTFPMVSTVPSRQVRDSPGIPRLLLAKMEHLLGGDFPDVRIERDSTSALRLNARAFTQGNQIHVAPGQWAPETPKGQELLGHELGHVLQQRAGRMAATEQLGRTNINDDPALEREADALGEEVAHAKAGDVQAAGRTLLRGVQHIGQGTIQRLPFGEPPNIHAPLLDDFSRDTGISRETATQHDPAYTAWLRVTSLDRLTTEQLLATLTDIYERGQLDALILDTGVISSLSYQRVITAMQVVRQSRSAGASAATALATVAASGLPPADQLAMTHYVRVPAARGADQRAAIAPGGDAALPNADLTREIGFELEPSSRPAPPAPVPAAPLGAPAPQALPPPPRIPWDGQSGAPGAAVARTAMQAELFNAYDAYLTFKRPQTVARLAQNRVAFSAPAAAPGGAGPAPTGVVDIANQARAVLETRYATLMDAAASSAAQVSDRSVRQVTGPGQNIFDASSEADRSAVTNTPDLAPGVARWLFRNDVPGAAGPPGSRRFASEILAAHRYSVQDDPGGAFRISVADAYAAASTVGVPDNRRLLIDFRMAQWSERGTRGITLQASFNPGANPARAELVQRWNVFKTATHESLHLRTHPAFRAATQRRDTMSEGFVEMFSIATLNSDVLPRARAGSVEPLRRAVEGVQSPAAPDATIITNSVSPTEYAEHRAEAERIRDGGTAPGGAPHAGVGEAAVRAAFFQGHVEYLGLASAGSQLATLPATGAAAQTRIPGRIAGLEDLAWRSGVPRATIERDNPGITDALPPTAVLSGCREHWVVAGETRDKIAVQNGVSEADLMRANPDIPLDPATSAWPALATGQRILISVH
jgi:hypothetical protein